MGSWRFVEEVVLMSAALVGSDAQGLLQGFSTADAQRAKVLLTRYLELDRQGRKGRMGAAFAPGTGAELRVEALAAQMPSTLLQAFSRSLPSYLRPRNARTPPAPTQPRPRLEAWAERMARECLQ
jgi:hypothetical protein